jgi:hypothetical protein
MGRSGQFIRSWWEPRQTPEEALGSGTAPQQGLSPRESALREDLGKEYYAILGVVSEYDGRLMTIKGWSVTLSLAGLGLGFQQQHYALFALAAATALAFWYVDALMKGFQLRYYWRMRDIEVAAFQINAVLLNGLGRQSAPRIDMSWGYKGRKGEESPRVPVRRSARNVHTLLQRRLWMPQVLLPHMVAVVIGVVLFVVALLHAPGFGGMRP